MPAKRRRAEPKGTIGAARKAVVAAKAAARGRAWSLLHRTESILALADGARRASTHAMKAKKKKKKRARTTA
jgi:hypothetical protein